MASATAPASMRGQRTSAPEASGIGGLKFASGVADPVINAQESMATWRGLVNRSVHTYAHTHERASLVAR